MIVKDVLTFLRPEPSPRQHGRRRNRFRQNEKPVSAQVHPAAACSRIVCKDAVIEDQTTLVTFLSDCAITLSVENASLDAFTLYFCSGMNE